MAKTGMEFVQFYPTATGKRGSRLLLYERVLTQPGVVLRDAQGEDIMKSYGVDDATQVTRDRLAQIIYESMNRAEHNDQGICMDLEALPEQNAMQLSVLLPSRWWKGQKVFKVTPTAHFCMGGIVTDPSGETSLKGLFAVGEATAGVHGANRLGGNALAEIFSLGGWIGEKAARRAKSIGPLLEIDSAVANESLRLERTESRGSHYRRDYPQEDNHNWLANIVLRKGHSGIVLEKAPVSLDLIQMHQNGHNC